MKKQKTCFYRFLVIGFILLVSNSYLYAQKEKHWEIGVLGGYIYHLEPEDAAFPVEKSVTDFNVDFRIAYYMSPSKLFGLYSSLNFGYGLIERGFPGWPNVDDASKNFDVFLGTTFNPLKSSKFWFHIGIGVNKLVIEGEDFVTTGGSGGVQYVGGGMIGAAISNLQGEGKDMSYPEFSRTELAMDIGFHQKLVGKFYFYANYKPIYAQTIRHDFNVGFSFVF